MDYTLVRQTEHSPGDDKNIFRQMFFFLLAVFSPTSSRAWELERRDSGRKDFGVLQFKSKDFHASGRG